ncbi:MAG: hypothetical protein QMB37_07095 [Paludibacteraceae bacterium]
MPHQLYLSIAGFSICLRADCQLMLDDGFTHFTVDSTQEADITIECRNNDSLPPFENAEKVFTSANDELKFYEIYRRGDDLIFRVFDQQNQTCIQQTALLDGGLKRWIIWSEETDGVLEPLVFPMAPILLHYAVLTADAVMMHASGVFDGEKGRLFSGFSGAGKSTISGIWKQQGNILINDDRLIIRKEKGEYFMYNTPMYYPDDNKKSPLHAVFLIRHSPENVINRMAGAVAVSSVMAFSIQNNYDTRFVQHHLDFFADMCTQIPVYQLGFVPDEKVVNFVKEKTR